MKVLNVLNEVCKAFLKENGRIIYGEIDDDLVGVSVDGLVVYVLHKKEFPFDRDAMLRGNQPFNFKKLIAPCAITDAYLTEEIRLWQKGQAQKLTDGTIDVWIDVKHLKNFNQDVTFKITAPKSPVMVYENGNLAGLILPINMKTEKE